MNLLIAISAFCEAQRLLVRLAQICPSPGQYFLVELGLHNWHRHYDPTLGRYTDHLITEASEGARR